MPEDDKVRYYEYSATLKGERRTAIVRIRPGYPNDRKWLKGELRLWIDNDEGLYEEFYGSNPSDKVLNAKHKDVTITEVEL